MTTVLLVAVLVTLGGVAEVGPPPPVPAPEVSGPWVPDASDSLRALLPNHGPMTAPSAERHFEQGLQLVRLEAKIDAFDTSGPGWSSYVRGAGYVLLPFGLLMAPYLASGNSPVSLLVPESARSLAAVSGPLQTVHTTGWAVLGTSIALLTIGVVSGVTGWILKKVELAGLERQRDALRAEYEGQVVPSSR